jgi:plastocyanin
MSRFLFVTALLLTMSVSTQAQTWTTIQGQVVLKEAPKPAEINVTADKEHCLSKGALKSDSLVVNEKNKGMKNVWVFLRPDDDDRAAKLQPNQIHPDLTKPTAKEHVIDQPCCMFIPRVLAVREGDTLLVKNSSPVPHNINYSSEDLSFNQTIPAGGTFKAEKALKFEGRPATFACNVHPWMAGRVMVFDHPYYALTDADGKFEIKNAPQGKFRIVYRHEEGFHMGAKGNKGFPLQIAGPTMELKSLEFVFDKK